MAMNWEIATAQSRGGRSTQEDALAVFDQRHGKPLVLALADGAGGHAGGELASQAAIARIGKEFPAAPVEPAAADAWLAQTIAQANKDVMDLGSGSAAPRTTLVLAWIAGTQARLTHIGDSRLYHFRAGQLAHRSRDDSVVQLLVDMKKVTEVESHSHPDRNRLLKALGAQDLELNPAKALTLGPGDGLVLCSDGVWEHAGPAELGAALAAPHLEKSATELVRMAVGKAGVNADNASVILARLV
jgi:serine/threonine protein phosphatase PrpC